MKLKCYLIYISIHDHHPQQPPSFFPAGFLFAVSFVVLLSYLTGFDFGLGLGTLWDCCFYCVLSLPLLFLGGEAGLGITVS